MGAARAQRTRSVIAARSDERGPPGAGTLALAATGPDADAACAAAEAAKGALGDGAAASTVGVAGTTAIARASAAL